MKSHSPIQAPSGGKKKARYWQDYEIQRENGEWTTSAIQDRFYKEHGYYPDGVLVDFVKSELKKAADSARVKVVEEIEKELHVLEPNCGDTWDEWKDGFYDGISQVFDLLNSSLTDTNTKE